MFRKSAVFFCLLFLLMGAACGSDSKSSGGGGESSFCCCLNLGAGWNYYTCPSQQAEDQCGQLDPSQCTHDPSKDDGCPGNCS